MKLLKVFLCLIVSVIIFSCAEQIDNTADMLVEVEQHYQLSSSDIEMIGEGITEDDNAYVEFNVHDNKGFIIDAGDRYVIMTYDSVVSVDKRGSNYGYRCSEVTSFVASELLVPDNSVTVVYLGYTGMQNHYWRYQVNYNYGYVVEVDGSLVIEDEVDGI